jgi:hypothetical protein
MLEVFAAPQYTRCDPEMLLSYRSKANAELMRAANQVVVGTRLLAAGEQPVTK